MPRSASPEADRDGRSGSSRYRDDEKRHRESRNSRDRDQERASGASRTKSEVDDDDAHETHRSSHRRRRDSNHRSSRHRETSEERRDRKRRHKERRNGGDSNIANVQREQAAEALLYAMDPIDGGANGISAFENDDKPFKWIKKAEQERKMGITPEQAKQRDKERRIEAEREIARLNERREEREREMALREQDQARMARLNESAAMSEWVAREDDFYLEQSRKRAVIRIREGRAKPIDLLAINLRWLTGAAKAHNDDNEHPATATSTLDDEDEDDLDVDLEEPYMIFDNLSMDDLQDLRRDISMYLSLERDQTNVEFWQALQKTGEAKFEDIRADVQRDDHSDALEPSVKREINAMLTDKTMEQLNGLQAKVKAKLQGGDQTIDAGYWQGLLEAIAVWQARSRLRDMYETILTNRLENLRKRQRAEEDRRKRLGLPSVDEERVTKAAEAAQRRAEQSQISEDHNDTHAASSALARQTVERLGEDEELLDATAVVERGLSAQTYTWEDKYRPRKPQYFNKVHTGYEWNKYNRTHYDSDNPPPKQVQGYKFNIFYPDLIDTTKAPTFRIVKDRSGSGNGDGDGHDDGETCTIIFEAGPPYETIGFRIVDRPWNMSRQRGFKAQFDRGILQLHFNFRKLFYRK